MPQIHEYTAPEGIGLRPTETGVESTAAAARRVGGAYSESAQLTKEAGSRIGSAVEQALTTVGDYQARQEISHGAAALAGLMNSKTKQWHDTNGNADPNDPAVAQNYQQSVEADLAKFKSGFLTQKGQDWAESRIEALRNHLYSKSNADRGTASGHARTINANTALQGFANAAMWDPTENGLKSALDQWEHSGQPAAVIEEGKKQIVERNANGYVRQNAAQPDYLKKPEYRGYLDARETDKLVQMERQTRRANELADKATRAQSEYQAKQQYQGEADKIYRDTLPVNNDARPQLPTDINERMTKLMPAPDAPTAVHNSYNALVKHVNTIAERLNKPEPPAVTSHRNYMDLVDKIHKGQITDLSQIDDAGQTLTTTDYNRARKEFNDRLSEDGIRLSDHKKFFLEAVKPAITKGLDDVLNPTVGMRFYDFRTALDSKIAQYKAQGKDPHLLMTPDTPDYMGNPAELQKYESSMTIQMQQKANPPAAPQPVAPPVATAPAPAKPPAPPEDNKARRAGESPSDWLARTGRMQFKPTAPVVPASQ